MSYWALCAAIVGGAALCIDGILAGRRRSRRWVWLVAMVASVVLPVLISSTRSATVLLPARAVITVSESPAVALPLLSRVDLALLFTWIGASLTLSIILVASAWRTRRLLRTCRTEIIAGRNVFVSADFGPALVGAFRSRIVVPTWTLGLSENDRALIVLHEAEHARSQDPLLAMVGIGAVVLMPWNVALWWQLSRLRLAVELDCDTRVVARCDDDALEYSRLLLSVREQSGSARHPSLALSYSRSSLARRLDALLRRGRPRIAPAVGLGMLAASLLGTMGFIPAPRTTSLIDALRRPTALARATGAMAPAARAASHAVAPIVPSVAARSSAAVKLRRAPSSPVTKSLNDRIAALGASTLPPVRVVTANPMAELSATRAPLPRARGGFVFRSVGGASAGAGGVWATRTPTAAVGFIIRALETGTGAAAGGVSTSGERPPVTIRAIPRPTTPTPPDTLLRRYVRTENQAVDNEKLSRCVLKI
jgi:beta-lactamase regulating signal transducer with metallopeptidase domain